MAGRGSPAVIYDAAALKEPSHGHVDLRFALNGQLTVSADGPWGVAWWQDESPQLDSFHL
jgi:hypothetical protein